MHRRGDDVRVLEGRQVHARRHEAGDVHHCHHEERADLATERRLVQWRCCRPLLPGSLKMDRLDLKQWHKVSGWEWFVRARPSVVPFLEVLAVHGLPY